MKDPQTSPFEAAPGDALPPVEMGPLALADLVRWAAYQENWLPLHYDRSAAQAQGLRDCVQSGHHRTALMARMITDWLGPAGWVKRLAVRHVAPVHPGDTIRCEGRVRGSSVTNGRARVELDVWATKQDGRRASEGEATVELDEGAAR